MFTGGINLIGVYKLVFQNPITCGILWNEEICMRLSFSKSLGGSFRIYSSQSFGAKKMTQAKIAAAKKEQFLKNVAQVSQFYLGDFCKDVDTT